MQHEKAKILEQPVEQLGLSQGCIYYLKNTGFSNLSEVTAAGWQGLRESADFDYLYFNELVRFLDQYHMVHLMEK